MTVGDQGSPALLAPTKFLPAGLSFPICDTGIWAWPEELPGLTLLQPVVCVCVGGGWLLRWGVWAWERANRKACGGRERCSRPRPDL